MRLPSATCVVLIALTMTVGLGTAVFADHHPFRVEELHELQKRARGVAADALVTTAKDAVRLPQTDQEMPILVLRIGAAIEDCA